MPYIQVSIDDLIILAEIFFLFLKYTMPFFRSRRQYESHVAEDMLEKKILEIRPRLELLDKMEKLNEDFPDPNISM